MAQPDPIPPTISPEIRKKAHRTNSAFAKGRIIEHAATLELSIMEAAAAMREQLSPPALAPDASESAKADGQSAVRAAAGVLARLAVGWDTVLDRVRVVQGKPLPGQKRPIPDELKVPKARKSNAPPDPV